MDKYIYIYIYLYMGCKILKLLAAEGSELAMLFSILLQHFFYFFVQIQKFHLIR